jgi:hypothetical protein
MTPRFTVDHDLYAVLDSENPTVCAPFGTLAPGDSLEKVADDLNSGRFDTSLFLWPDIALYRELLDRRQ